MGDKVGKKERSSLALRGKTFAVFTANGMRVDLERYFKSEAGKKALSENLPIKHALVSKGRVDRKK